MAKCEYPFTVGEMFVGCDKEATHSCEVPVEPYPVTETMLFCESHTLGKALLLEGSILGEVIKNEEQNDVAVDWLTAVRKFGLEKANEMFPS